MTLTGERRSELARFFPESEAALDARFGKRGAFAAPARRATRRRIFAVRDVRAELEPLTSLVAFTHERPRGPGDHVDFLDTCGNRIMIHRPA